MVITGSTLDPKEERPEIPNRKGMENTVDKRAEENPSLASKMSDTSDSEADVPPQTVMTWMIVSVVVGLITIYTMVHWISNKLAQGIENSKITEKQTNQQKNATDISSQDEKKTILHRDTCCSTTNHEIDLQRPQEMESCDSSGTFENLAANDFGKRNGRVNQNDLPERNLLAPGKITLSTETVEHNTSDVEALSCCGENYEGEILKVSEMCETHEITEAKTKNTMKRFDTDGPPHPAHGSLQCRDCQSIHNSHVTSVQMGPGFTGNLSIRSECGENRIGCFSSNDNYETTDNEENWRSAATLQNYIPNQTTPVRVNSLQTKCLTCNKEMSREGLTSSVEYPTDCNIKPHSKTEGQQLPNGVEQQNKIPTCTTENKIDCPEHQPPSTIRCILTPLKSLSCDCDVPVAKDLPLLSSHPEYRPRESLQSSFSDATFPLQDRLDQYDRNDNIIGESGLQISFTTKSKDTKNTTKTVSTENHPDLESTKDNLQEVELETPRSSFLRSVRADPALSKSLDSQIESLKKGCQLLEKRPSKSALRSSGSEECLKKFVHFPEDIRHIRTVHKYHSFDETWCDFGADDTTTTSTRNEEQKLN